ncbi:class I SAM-dependent methyltransferase [Inediibacterium massiliense]|uniref:class I SAM-dependent methyltransferase n=1 Tax=Inediibacterium massiliense TaxID=1658111 RepID=UPI0006B4006C|nr:class I SAM-dependent methyltransferase [Inediibacterium massiliense]
MDFGKRIKQYWEGEADIYSVCIEEELGNFQREAWKKIVLEYAPKKQCLDILDIGTGPGFFPIVLGEEGHHVTGIDITENMISYARKNVERAGSKANLLTMDCHNLEFEDDTFDLIVCRNLTWTLDNPIQAYEEWHRVLKPSGRLLIFDANWYLHLFDEKLREKYEENEKKLIEKYGRKTHNHKNNVEGDALSKKLFMSNKVRPQWDLNQLIQMKFSKVFSEINIVDQVWDDMGKELNATTPQFLVGAEK